MSMYIFAIGGSGSRILRSLTMLLASGVQVKSDIVPIIIDPDTQNGDLQRTVWEMSLYERIHNQLTFNNQTKSKFFSANIKYFNQGSGVQSFTIPIDGATGINFENYINLATMSSENQSMMRMLFSNDNLASSMNVGFKGNPNIGSIVLNQFTQSKAYSNFEGQFVDGDKVVILSSIFGGTGAAGFPLLLKSMRTSTNTALSKAYIGAVSLLPYFNLQDDSKSKIKADSFITKMKAALNYYERNVTGNGTLDEMYYLGDALSSKTYNNYDGGQRQENDAHIIEMLAALAVVDFDNRNIPVAGAQRNTKFHEFSLETNYNSSIQFSDFGPGTNGIIRKSLSQMAIMNGYINKRSDKHQLSQRWTKDRRGVLGKGFFNGGFLKDYRKFKEGSGLAGDKSGFEQWLSQMAGNDKSFAPFADDNNLNPKTGLEKVHGIKPNYSFRSKKGYNLMDERLSQEFRHLPKNISAPSLFMELFYVTTKQLCEKNLNIQ